MPFRHCAIRADRAEVPSESARFWRKFRETSMKVPGTGLPDLECDRRGWVGSLAYFTKRARGTSIPTRWHRRQRMGHGLRARKAAQRMDGGFSTIKLLLINLQLTLAGIYTHLTRRPRTRVDPKRDPQGRATRHGIQNSGRPNKAPRQPTHSAEASNPAPRRDPVRCPSGGTSTRGQRSNAASRADQHIHGARTDQRIHSARAARRRGKMRHPQN